MPQNQQTKYYGLQILEQVIKTRWKVLPRNQCEGIKKYIVGLIIKTSSDPETMEASKVYLNKLNMILVQVSYLIKQSAIRCQISVVVCINCQCYLYEGAETRVAKKLGIFYR